MKPIAAIAIAFPLCCTWAAVAHALPLQPGAYSWASNYIQIAKRGDRWCYQGFTVRATVISSMSPDPKQRHLYHIDGMKGVVLRQDRPDQISYGDIKNLLPYAANREFGTTLTAEMTQCLNAKQSYYKQIKSTRQ